MIATDGQPAAVIVLADQPTAVARYAAEELVYHVEKATGAKLAIVSEAGPRPAGLAPIYLGDTRAARSAGLEVKKLAPEIFVYRTVENALFIAGNDAVGDPLEPATFAGTLLGVYELLERELGVRWLWPGELGTFVPKRRTLAISAHNETIVPHFFQRNVRGGLTFTGKTAALGFSPAAAADYAQAQTVFIRRHRMGRSERLFYRHAFTDWWEKYGQDHPEWFQLYKGKRGPPKPGDHYSMCVSNPEFHREIVAQWQRRRESDPQNAPRYLNIAENGIVGFCECEPCRAWDGPTPPDYLDFYAPKSKMALTGKRFVTDRYARFWLAVQRLAEEIDPQVVIVAYNYFNYFYYPSPEIKLNDRILIGAYPSSGWYPRSPEENAWFRKQWAGWQATGAQLFSRGNYCLDGYTMPHGYAHQFTDEFKDQVKRGMVATDYDALTGQWAAQGPNIYLLMRLHTRPDATADELLAEYYAAFGAAAPQVKAYFDYWERYAVAQIPLMQELFADNTTRWRTPAKVSHHIYPEAAFVAAEKFLAEAAAAVAGDSEARARVQFIQNGLTHAKLCVRAASLLSLSELAADPARSAEALRELIAFRRAHEREWIANFNHSAWTEEASWRLPAEQLSTTP
ncbi:DUF4838 domain-containing protein [Oleiharenicola lentus]|uniref:DUF4838 domain-containing protein n=1 Tax=Oleiharenicola lentus TaxID=2508720 RepID=UPI003F667CD0